MPSARGPKQRRRPKPSKPSAAPPETAPEGLREGEAEREAEPALAGNQLEGLRRMVDSLYARLALHSEALNALPVWITVKDREGRYLLVNDALAQSYAATAADFVGRTTTETREMQPDILAEIEAIDRRVMETGERTELPRYGVRLPSGRERLRRLTKSPLRDDDGSIIGIVGWSEDITEQVLAEDALDANRALMRAVVDVVPHPVSLIDSDFRLMMVNPAWCRLVEADREAVEGLTILEMERLPLDVRQAMYGDNVRLMRDGNAIEPREVAMPDATGAERFLVVSKSPVRGPDGEMQGIVTVAVDVTELKRAEEDARVARERMEAAMESMPAGLHLYDAEGRMEYANAMIRTYFPQTPFDQPGMYFEDLVRHSMADLQLDEAAAEDHLQRRLAEFSNPPEHLEFVLRDGRHIMGHDRRIRDGGTISVRFDITEQKRIQAELEQRERQTQIELRLAAELQRALLRPVEAPPFLSIAYRFRPSGEVSGDIYSTRTAPDDGFQFFIGDATGHGVSAAFMTMLVEAALTRVPAAASPDALLGHINRELGRYELDGRFVSGIALRIDPDGTLTLANAGHPQAVVLPRQGAECVIDEAGGFALGWFADAVFQPIRHTLLPGDRVLVFTDGLTECCDAQGQQLGLPALLRSAVALNGGSPEDLAEGLLQRALDHANEMPITDDVTLFVFEYGANDDTDSD